MSYKLLRSGKILRNYIPTVNSFSPLNYSPIVWYDSSDVSSFTKDINNNISQWNDKSGNNYHMTQLTTSYQPTWSSNGIVFNSDKMYCPSFGTTYVASFQIFMVAKFLTSNTGYYMGLSTYNWPVWFSLGSVTATNKLEFWGANFNMTSNKTYPMATKSIFMVDIDNYRNPNGRLYENSNLITSANPVNIQLSKLSIGGWLDNDSYNMNGTVYEILIYHSNLSGPLSTEQITNVNNYLTQKYSI